MPVRIPYIFLCITLLLLSSVTVFSGDNRTEIQDKCCDFNAHSEYSISLEDTDYVNDCNPLSILQVFYTCRVFVLENNIKVSCFSDIWQPPKAGEL